MASLNIQWICLVVIVLQDTFASTRQYRDFRQTPADDELREIIDYIHSKGMRVQLRPMLECWDGAQRIQVSFPNEVEIIPGKPMNHWTRWFDSMVERTLHYASLAQRSGCEAYGLDSELDFTVHQQQHWLRVVSAALSEKNLVLLRDFHLFLGNDPNPVLVRKLKDVLHRSKTEAKTVLLLGCRCDLPPELQREITTLTFSLPGREELEPVLNGLLESAPQLKLKPQERESLLEATRGLTTIEAENALALSIVETGKMVPAIIHREKAQSLKQNGLLEIVDAKVSIDAVCGLDQLKGWLQKRKAAFSKEAKAYGLPAPKGMLVFGVSGTGKSLTAKATASVFDVPLLRLDVGRLFGSLVGQTESNLRLAIQTAEAIAPVCL